ncbi:MAG TPA: metallophosphoesterase [Verrucomicrobiae bacterium]
MLSAVVSLKQVLVGHARALGSASPAIFLLAHAVCCAAPAPVGAWDFDDSNNLLKATVGADLTLQGTVVPVAGARAGDGAARIGIGSYFECAHGLSPGLFQTLVNRYSLLIDFRLLALGPWYCFFQTDSSNQTDGDCFVRAADGAIGVAQTGYSGTPASAGVWQRLIVSVDNLAGIYRLYLDGEEILRGNPQVVDGRFSLEPLLLLFADNDGEDAELDVSRVAIYAACLSGADAAELGGVLSIVPGNNPPAIGAGSGPTSVVTGQTAEWSAIATDPESDTVQVRVDWGDGSDLSPWSTLAGSGQTHLFSHIFRRAGTYVVRALPRDAKGQTGVWTELVQVSVSGSAIVQYLTPPYLQNPRTNAITVMWELDGQADAEVRYGPDMAYGQVAVAQHSASSAGTEVYRCTLTNLLPGRSYFYQVQTGTNQGPSGQFSTAPLGSPDFSFAVWSDSQGSNHGSYPADPLEPTKSMFRHMATNGISLAVTSGDLAESGASYTDTRQFYLDRVAALLGTRVPWYVAWGNHDGGPTTVIRQFADLPSQERPGFGPGYGSYSFDYGGCHFICIDNASSYEDIPNWLAQDLASEANRQARFTFLFVHVPPFCEVWLDGDAWLRANLVPLMESYGVDACFSGHTHEYERGESNGVFYCVTGGGCWLDIPEVLITDWPQITVGGFSDIPGIVRPRPDAGGGLINEYVRVDVRGDTFTASMTAFSPDGSVVGVLDQFAKTRSPEPQPLDLLYAEDFETVPEFALPAGWTATHHTTIDADTQDPNDPRSNLYLTWTVVSSNRLGTVFGGNRLSVPGIVNGRCIYAESDQRSGVQLQYFTTPDLNVKAATNVQVQFKSNYMQNQDSLAALEYSVDQGQTWLPALYLLDGNDVVRAIDGSADGAATFTRVDPSGVPTADGTAAFGGTYGEHILSRPFSNLGPYVQARADDDPTESKRIESVRLTAADGRQTVRLRFTLVGTSSWFWGIDDLQLLGRLPTSASPLITSVSLSTEGIRIEWRAAAGQIQVQRCGSIGSLWENVSAPIDAAQGFAVVPVVGDLGFLRLQLSP